MFDLSASMYRFQHDGRLLRSQETAVMLMESFAKLDRKDKYVWDVSENDSNEWIVLTMPTDIRSCKDYTNRQFTHPTDCMPFAVGRFTRHSPRRGPPNLPGAPGPCEDRGEDGYDPTVYFRWGLHRGSDRESISRGREIRRRYKLVRIWATRKLILVFQMIGL